MKYLAACTCAREQNHRKQTQLPSCDSYCGIRYHVRRARSHSFSESFMRVCQPSPVTLKASRISASKRIVVLTLPPLPAGLPQRLAASCRASGRETGLSPTCQTPCSKNSSVNTGASSGSTQALPAFCYFAFIVLLILMILRVSLRGVKKSSF